MSMTTKSNIPFLCVVVFGLLFVSQATSAQAPASAADTHALLEAYSKQVTTMSGSYILTRVGVPDTHIDLKWDLKSDLINATSYYIGQKDPVASTWVLGKTQEWHAEPEPKAKQAGAWIVEMAARDEMKFPRNVLESGLGLKFLRQEMLGYSHGDDGGPSPGETFQQHIDPHSGHLIFTDTVVGEVKEWTEYELDLSDGLRVLRATGYSSGYGPQPFRIYEGIYTDHVKSNSIWIPRNHDIKYYLPGKDGKVEIVDRTSARFERVEANPAFKDTDFVYVPPYGSAVHAAGSNLYFRSGYNNPFSEGGKDKEPSGLRNVGLDVSKSPDVSEQKSGPLSSVAAVAVADRPEKDRSTWWLILGLLGCGLLGCCVVFILKSTKRGRTALSKG
jgi:hypothetical protein